MSSAVEMTLAVGIHLFDTEHLPEEVCEGQEESNFITPHGRVIQILFSEEDSGPGVSLVLRTLMSLRDVCGGRVSVFPGPLPKYL